MKLAGALETTPGELCEGIAWQPSKRRFEVKRPPRAELSQSDCNAMK